MLDANVSYPIFLRDRAGVVYLFHSESEFTSEVSPIEIEFGEYRGWDREGFRLSMTVEEESLHAKRLSDRLEMEQLIIAITDYAKVKTGNKYPLNDPTPDPVILFHAVEGFIASNPGSFWWKLFD